MIDNKNFKHDILLGLDSIITFRLCQDYHCKITQSTDHDEETNNIGNRNIAENKSILDIKNNDLDNETSCGQNGIE